MMTTKNNYSKGLTLTAEELQVLQQAIEIKINNTMLNGCSPERFKILQGISKRIENCKQ